MNLSWNFILNFEESGRLLLEKACEVTDFLPSNASIENIVETLCQTCSSEEIEYSDFLRISCQQYGVFKAESNDEGLENSLLGYILSEYVRRMSEEEHKKFAFDQGFTSNEFVDFKMELKIRMASSPSFVQKLPLLVLSLVGIDITDYLVIPEMFGVSHPEAMSSRDISSHFPILSAIIALGKESRRQFSKDNYYKYLDFLIRSDNVFPNQEESTLSVMLSAYQVLGDRSKPWFECVEKSVWDYLGGRKTSITRYVLESMKEFYGSSKNYLMYRLMKRLFPCDKSMGDCYHDIFYSNDIQFDEDIDKVVFYDYLFPYSPISDNARYALRESSFENLAGQLFLAVERSPYEHILSISLLNNRLFDYAIVREYEEYPNVMVNKKILKTTGGFDRENLQKNIEKFAEQIPQEFNKASVLMQTTSNNLVEKMDELSMKGAENAFAIAPESPDDNKNLNESQLEQDEVRIQLERDYRKCEITEDFMRCEIIPRIESILEIFTIAKDGKPIDVDRLEQRVDEVAGYLKDVGKNGRDNAAFECQEESINSSSMNEAGNVISNMDWGYVGEITYKGKSNEWLNNEIQSFVQYSHVIRHDSAPIIGEICRALSRLRSNESVDFDFEIQKINHLIKLIKNNCSNGRNHNEEIELISEINLIVEHLEGNNCYAIEKDFGCDEAFVSFSKSDLDSIFQNIFDNIEHHAFIGLNTRRDKNKVKISVKKESFGILVRISNNGMPFDGDVKKVFNYKQKYGKTGHSGIGLYSVSKIMNANEGNVSFVSEPDKEFCVTLELMFKLNELDMNGFNILWLDDEFEPGSEHYEELLEWKRNAEKKHSFLITTCVNGNELLGWLNEKVYDAIIFDINGYLSENPNDSDNVPKDVLGKIYKDCREYIESHNVLKYCFTGAENVTNESETNIQLLLKEYGFERDKRDPDLKPLYDKRKGPVPLFEDIEDALLARNGKFKGFPSFKTVNDTVVDGRAKKCIDDIIDWYNASKEGSNNNFPHDGLRFVLEDIYKKLEPFEFFQLKSDGKPASHYTFINANFDGKTPYLNDKCRFEWEAAAIDFLGDAANKAKHTGSGQPNKNYDWAVFNAFVIFSNWYSRFIIDLYDQEKKMNYFLTLDYLKYRQDQLAKSDNKGKENSTEKHNKKEENSRHGKFEEEFKVKDFENGRFYPIDFDERIGLDKLVKGDEVSYNLKVDKKGQAIIACNVQQKS